MEPCPDITCAEDVPEDYAGLRKYFEPNFEAMLIDQKGDTDEGNPREDLDIQGTRLRKTAVEPKVLYNQGNGYLGGECMRIRHKEAQELKTDRSICIQVE